MSHIIPFLVHHGYAVIFGAVLVELIGLPISAVPLMLAAGALAGMNRLSFAGLWLVAVLAALTGDSAWYQLGRRRGYGILRILCRISLEPDSCVRRTQARFARQGGRALLVAKFIPGLGAVAAPLAGLLRMPPLRFLAWDGAGSVLWAGAYLGAGYLFSPQLELLGHIAARLGVGLAIVLAVGIACYFGWKYRQRQRFLRDLRVARITPEELSRKMESGEGVVVVDLRGFVEFEADSRRVPGAIHLLPEELDHRHQEIPRDRDIVLYCT